MEIIMAVYQIYSIGINKATKQVVGYRKEFIDTKVNELFEPEDDESSVKRKYENFWNIDRYNPIKVEIGKVKRQNRTSHGENWGIEKITREEYEKVVSSKRS